MSKKNIDIDWYLENTTILSYYDEEHIPMPEIIFNVYYPLKTFSAESFSVEIFIKFVDEKIKEYNIKDIDYSDSLEKKINCIEKYFCEKLWNLIELQDWQSIDSVFKKGIEFAKKCIIGQDIFDDKWKKRNIPDYDDTDWKSFYKELWSDSIVKIWNKLKIYSLDLIDNIQKFRETRNKFIEHLSDTVVRKNWNDFRREVEFLWLSDNYQWGILFSLNILSTWKKYTITLSPMLDFIVFIDTFLEVTKILK